MNASDRILVTGAGGFIGGHLVARLAASGFHRVRAVDCKPLRDWHQHVTGPEAVVADLRQFDACNEVMSGVDYVFNLAADMGGMGFIESHKADCMLSVLISTHLLLAARNHSVKRFFYSSSACVYNQAKQRKSNLRPLREVDVYPADPEDGYGWEKLFTERMCRHFREEFTLETRVARYHNVYGPFGTFEGGREKAPAAICRKVAQAALLSSDEIEIWGDGQQTRSFTYIDDCVEGTLRVMDGGYSAPLNLGSKELVSIDELVDIIEEIAGVRLRRVYNPQAPQGVRGRNSDNTLIERVLGWQPSTSLRAGLEKTYAWVFGELAQSQATKRPSQAR